MSKTKRTCLMCGSGFEVFPSVVAAGKGFYCSKSCSSRKKREIIIKDDFALVPLTQNKHAIIDIKDIDIVKNITWHAVEKVSKNVTFFYARGWEIGTGNGIHMHRLILGVKDTDIMVDHRWHDTLDNRRDNLRVCSNSQNQINRLTYKSTIHTSTYKGVSKNKKTGKWRALIYKNNKRIAIGTFKKEIDAAKAYNKEALNLFGSFAHLNEIS